MLVLEDARDTQLIIQSVLSGEFELIFIDQIAQISEDLLSQPISLFLLDVMLPDGESWSLCEKIRANSLHKETPILFLTSKEAITDKLRAFSIGADDYVTKPFNPLELKARVELRLKKNEDTSNVIRLGPVEVNRLTKRACILEGSKKRKVELTKTEYRLLVYFISNRSHALSRDQILSAVWGESYVFDRTVDAHISKLRKKLSPYSDMIQSVHGEGYRMDWEEGQSKAS